MASEPAARRVLARYAGGGSSGSSEVRSANTTSGGDLLIYIGTAPAGTAESAAGWTVTRQTINTATLANVAETATGSWDNRASLPYS